ncbi:hypothetical protein STAS_21298 [Striga asiatica]|uniref:Uncharacterized protein n=1 Tax=Striga asiatica TaxID=4170 RepID=A0A5A7QIS8_STRAF|nr:hypothetical protein STAS_21298 [Striga asiatica]
MAIPEINMITDFEAGMKCLQNPSLISRLDKVPQAYSFWKWGALFFAIFATFSSIFRRIKLILVRFHTIKPSSHQSEEVFEFSEEDETSLASSDDDGADDKAEDHPTTSFRSQRPVDENFSVKGVFRGQWPNGNLRNRKRRCGRGAWSEFASGKSVVRLWDSLGLNLDFDEDLFSSGEQSVVSTWDSDRDGREIDFAGGAWGAPAVLTAEGNRKGGGVILGGYDGRMQRRFPALYAEWGLPAEAEKVGGVSTGGDGKVYVRNDVGGVVAVGDVRNVRRPLESVKESDGNTWWDGDAVIVENE